MKAVGIRVLAACLGAASIVLLARCGSEPSDGPGGSGGTTVSHDSARYVGAARCASCHPTEHALWQGSHHDLAMQGVNEQTVLGDFADAEFTHFETTARFYREGEAFVVETQGADGELDDLRENYDCLKKFRERMNESGEVSGEELDAIDSEVMALIEEAVTGAKAAARPTPAEVTQDVYINYGSA